MFPRTEYEMTPADLAELMKAFKSTPVMFLSGGTLMGSSPQENANLAWKRLGEKMGFDGETVRPIQGKGSRFFTAIPSENEVQRAEREAVEKEATLKKKIADLENEIAERQTQLTELFKAAPSGRAT